ncbi:MAG: redox-regulated ATPase YchF [Nitrospirae bacterium RBG_13_39_12]|nr:MAG: redox-regulated ATPase YchF [Nitrospirae bacterium RBG_13_39_12]
MKLSIIGLSNSGKTTIFNALTGMDIETTAYPTTNAEPRRCIVKVPDSRLDKLSEIFRPRKTTHATIEYVDYIGLTKGDVEQNRKVFDLIKDVDAIVHVDRAFKDESVVHPLGSVDPLRDAETIELELIFGDLEFVEKRLNRMEQGLKRGKKPDESERKLLLKCKNSLGKEIGLRYVEFNEEEHSAMRPLQFLSTKPEVIVLNVEEKDLNTDHLNDIQSSILKMYPFLTVLTMCGKIEMEIARLSPGDAQLFLDDLGIKETAANKVIHTCYKLLGLISFFTYVGDEVRAWTMTKGQNAQKAAGKVHSDIERGFIRAEVISFDDFISAGSIHVAREKGVLRLEGKGYEVDDGDIINFRFNI